MSLNPNTIKKKACTDVQTDQAFTVCLRNHRMICNCAFHWYSTTYFHQCGLYEKMFFATVGLKYCYFSGVTVQRSGGDINIHAKRIISDAGVLNTFKYLLPREIAQNCRKFV